MTPTTINRQTLLYALHVLDVQQAHAAQGSKTQQAYYEGMRSMLDIILTDVFRRQQGYVNLDASGHHSAPTALAAPESAADLVEVIPF